jgi:VWFA-related protein
MRPLLAGLLAALAAASVPAGAPRQTPTVQESATVTLVEVPVHAVGKDGHPLANLAEADFELFDDDQQQKITALDVVDLRRAAGPGSRPGPAQAPGSESPAARRHWLLLFDLSFSREVSISRAVSAASRFVSSGLSPGDLAAVASSSVDGGVRMHLNFTSDARQIAEAVRSVVAARGESRSLDPLSLALLTPGDPKAYHEPSRESKSGAGGLDAGVSGIYSVMARKSSDRFSIGRVKSLLTALSGLAKALDTVAGRKTVLYFSEGFDGRLLSGSLARPLSAEARAPENDAVLEGQVWAVDLDRRSGDSALHRLLDETLALFRRSDCTLYPIDIGGLKTENDDLTPKIRGEDALFAFASGTGGELLSDGNDLEEQIRRVADKTSLTYILSFQPSRRLGEGRYHQLKVRVKAAGAHVSARAGYYESRLFRTLSPLERTLSAAALVAHERGGGAWPMDVLAVPAPGEPLGRAAVVLEVPGRALLAGAGDRLRLGVYVYAMTEAGDMADFFARSLLLDIPRERARLTSGAFRYRGAVSLPPGAYSIRVLVRDEDRGLYAFRSIPVAVPTSGAAEFVLQPPIFFAPADRGVNLGDPTAASDTQTFTIGQESFIPALAPTLAVDQPVQLCLIGWGGTQAGPFQVEAAVVSRSGVSAPARFAILGREPSSPAGPVKLLAEFAPGPLVAGDAVLRVTLRDPAGVRKPAASEARFRVDAPR